MEKLLIFSLSILLLGCNESKSVKLIDYEQFSADARKAMADDYEAKVRFYQGSRYNQEKYDTLIMMNPYSSSYYQGKSITHTKIGDYHIAFPLLEKAASIDDEVLYYYGWVLLNNYHDFPRALQRLEEFDNLTPGQMDYSWGENVYHLKGLVHKEMGNYQAAIQEFSTCIEKEGLDKVDVYTIVYRGITYLKAGQYRNAVKDFDLSLELYPRCTMAFYYKGEALLKMGKKIKALESLESARTLLKRGIKKTDPYKDVFDEVHEVMINDLLKEAK